MRSHRPGFSESDAAFNLGMAFATAQTAAPGVYIAINGSVFHGDEVVKNRELGCFVMQAGSARLIRRAGRWST